jgi:gamma-glutamylcyclotransferase (GGCT)/AIG2-like uncharacterized protein YtfP
VPFPLAHCCETRQHGPVTESSTFSGEHRLATYGSLAPGGPNHRQLDGLKGRWFAGNVRGTLVEKGWGAELGYPGIILEEHGHDVEVQVFECADLVGRWPLLDEFEGSGYERVIAVVRTSSGDFEASIYALAVRPR